MSRTEGIQPTRLTTRLHRHSLSTMARPAALVLSMVGLGSGVAGCTAEGHGIENTGRFVVVVTGVNGNPAPPVDAPLEANLGDLEEQWSFTIQAVDGQGLPDPSYNSFVRLSVDPGAVNLVSGPGADGRNIRLTNGYAEGIASITAVFGPARLWVEDMGYEPAPDGVVPVCANGLDDDGDVAVDHPNDPGCAFADDMTEDPGRLITSVSTAVNYKRPSLADVQGHGSRTPYPSVSMQLETASPRDVVVTRVSSAGFFLTDLGDCERDDTTTPPVYRCWQSSWPDAVQCSSHTGCAEDCVEDDTQTPSVWQCPSRATGFNHIFAYNFNTPERMGVCDPLSYLSGTASEFFGFTELSFPSYETDHPHWTWENEQWTLHPENCRVPEPAVLNPAILDIPGEMEKHESGLVRIENFTISENIGPELAVNNVFQENRSNCDLNQDGVIDYTDTQEANCSNACADDPHCAEWNNFSSWGAFKMYQGQNRIRVSTSTAFGFDPLAHRGKTVIAVTGTLRNFSGGSLNWTLETRCIDDLVCDFDSVCQPAPVPSGLACVTLPSDIDNDSATY